MIQANVKMKGQEKVLKALKKVSNPDKLFDDSVKTTAAESIRNLKIESLTKQPGSKSFNYQGQTVTAKNLSTGQTAQAWKLDKKSDSHYTATNNRKTRDGKWNVAQLINDGHREIRPKTKRRLYMPLSRRGQSKPIGAVDRSLKPYEDFVLLKRVKPKKGTKFIDLNVKNSGKVLTKLIIKAIRRVYK